jgi:diguanylate cyclase (GGDEF)-like protein
MTADQNVQEGDRLAALDRYDILDTPPEETFDRITRLVSRLFDVPIATINLIDGHRQWFKSRRGMASSEVERGPGLCNVAIREGKPLVIPDARLDPRFAENKFIVGEPFIRFYAGAPLHTPDGHNIGTICAMDTKPHDPDPALIQHLTDLARIVIDELELRTLVTSDPLTGAMSRRVLKDQGSRMLALGQRHRHDVSCILCDLDGFAKLNELHGSVVGDALLVASAGTIRNVIRKSDLLARTGGDEFALLLPHTPRASALMVAEKLRAAIAGQNATAGDLPAVTASFGVVMVDRSVPDVETLLDHARAALQAAKADGGNRCAERQPAAIPANVRRRVFKAGKIAFNGGRSTIDCTIRSLSDSGASFDVISSAGIPPEFKLQIEADGVSRLSRIVTKGDRHIEVEFT